MYLNNAERVSSNLPGHFASLAVICGLATTVLMLKFIKFKASLNLSSAVYREDVENYPTTVENISLAGAYRVRKEEFFGNGSLKDPPKKITADMVKLPPSSLQPQQPMKTDSDPSAVNVPVTLRKGIPEVSMNPRGSIAHNRDSTDISQQTPKDKKLASKKEKEKKKARETKKKNKSAAPAVPLANPLSQLSPESTVSKTSGPPPYSDVPDKLEVVPNRGDDTGNTSFGKHVQGSSWDLVSQHRAQVSRPVPAQRHRAKDLKYSVGDFRGNSEV